MKFDMGGWHLRVKPMQGRAAWEFAWGMLPKVMNLKPERVERINTSFMMRTCMIEASEPAWDLWENHAAFCISSNQQSLLFSWWPSSYSIRKAMPTCMIEASEAAWEFFEKTMRLFASAAISNPFFLACDPAHTLLGRPCHCRIHSGHWLSSWWEHWWASCFCCLWRRAGWALWDYGLLWVALEWSAAHGRMISSTPKMHEMWSKFESYWTCPTFHASWSFLDRWSAISSLGWQDDQQCMAEWSAPHPRCMECGSNLTVVEFARHSMHLGAFWIGNQQQGKNISGLGWSVALGWQWWALMNGWG